MANMTIVTLRERARLMVRDLNGIYFSDTSLRVFSNEAIDRIKQVIPQLKGMKHLYYPDDEVIILPEEWQHLIGIYCSARLCTQDERFYQAGTFMNEFETKLIQLKGDYQNGDVEFIDPETGEPILEEGKNEYVKNTYYFNSRGFIPNREDR